MNLNSVEPENEGWYVHKYKNAVRGVDATDQLVWSCGLPKIFQSGEVVGDVELMVTAATC